MKLFENGVGRPSNEVLRKRKIVTLSIVTGVIAFVAILIGGITLLVSKSNNVDNLKGSANKANVVVLASQRKSIFSWLFDLFDIFIPKKTTITTKPSTTTTTTKTTKTTTITTKAPVANIKETKVLADECGFPYSKAKCSNSKNDTVKQIQTMLQKLGYNAKADGYYGTETESAVKEFQNKYKITPADGKVGYKELTTLAEKTSTTYFNIEYYKDSGVKADSKSGLKGVSVLKENGTQKVRQTIIKGINTIISETELKKSSYSHQGYYASTYSKDGKKYRYGCYSAKCLSDDDASWYSQTDIDEKAKSGKKFYHYLYKVGQTVSNTGHMYSGQKVNFTAKYCKTGYYYERKQSKCIKGNDPSLNGIFKGKKYALSDSELRGIAALCQAEQGSAQGAAAEASLIANRFEIYPRGYTNLYNYAAGCGWWANARSHMSRTPSSDVLKAVKDVLVNGNRTLPLYVCHHDCISCGSYGFDIVKIVVNGKTITDHSGLLNKSNYIKDKTVIYNKYGEGKPSWIFYSFPTKTSDPFGYTEYEKSFVEKRDGK